MASATRRRRRDAVALPPLPVGIVVVVPDEASVAEFKDVQFTAIPQDARGYRLSNRSVTWESSNEAIATIDANGLAEGVSVGGPITITATSEDIDGTASLEVFAAVVETVEVSPSSATVYIDWTEQLTATPKDDEGNPLVGRVITWESSDHLIATVDEDGLVTAVSETISGPITITATCEGVEGTCAITVELAPVATVEVDPSSANVIIGDTEQLTATCKDAQDNILTGRTVTWSSEDEDYVTVDSSGLVTAVDVGGPFTITATAEEIDGTSEITVLPIPVASVDVSPSSANVIVGETQQLTATPKDAEGNPLAGRTVTWSSDDEDYATVNSSGLVTAVAIGGPVTITATCETIDGTSSITVIPVPVATVEVSPSSATLAFPDTQQLTATTKDANGNVLTGRTVEWTTSDASKATVNSSGLVTAVNGGIATITATSETKFGESTITVTASQELIAENNDYVLSEASIYVITEQLPS